MTASERRVDALVLAALCFVCYFWRLGLPGLFDFNEGLYVEAAREMVLRGDYVTGRVNGVPFYDKPPLALWCAAVSFRALGISELAARLPVAISAALTTLLVYWLARRAFGRATGLLAACVVSLNILFIGTARQMTMDIHQTWWVTAALVAFFVGHGSAGRKRVWFYAAFYACCGLAFMAKSFPGLIPLPIAFLYITVCERARPREVWRSVWQAQPLLGVVILSAVIAPWHVAAYRQSGRLFIEEYWLLHHVQLLNAQEFSHAQPFWHYVPALFAGMFPWAGFLALAPLRRLALSVDTEEGRARALVVVWAVFTFVAFSLMRSKLLSYLLPMYPAAAVLVADAIVRSVRSKAFAGLRAVFVATAVICVGALLAALALLPPYLARTTDAEAVAVLTPSMVRFAWIALSIFATGSTISAVLAWARPSCAAPALAATTAAFIVAAWGLGLPAYDEAVNKPLRTIVRQASTAIEDGTPLIVHIGRPRRPSAFFYLPGRLFQGALPDPRAGFLLESWDAEPVIERIAREPAAWILADRRRAAETLAGLGGLSEAGSAGRWVLLRSSKDMGR